MTSEEKIKKALKFLLTTNAKGSSFDYYDNRAGKNEYEDWLFKFFERERIPQNEWNPIVNELANRDLIEVNPSETKINKTPPNQIKISFKGIALLDPNNQSIIIAKEEIENLTRINLKLQNEYLPHAIRQSKQRVVTFIIGGLLGILASMLPMLVDRCIPKKEMPIQVQIINSEKKWDVIKNNIKHTSKDAMKIR